MNGITELGYVRAGVSDMDEWRGFASEILGLEVFDENGRVFLRNDLWHHRIELLPNGSDDLEAMGLRVAGPEEFKGMQKTLSEASVAYRVCTREEASERYVLEVLELTDPAGVPLEIFHGPQVDTHRPFHPGRGMYGRFCTGVEGLGHSIIATNDVYESYDFYRLLGMRGSVEGTVPIDIIFMHCDFQGSRDHTLAFGPPPPPNKRINHLMMEVDNLDDVLRTIDIVEASPYEIAITPGRHFNDNQYSFYFVNPSGWNIEIGYDSRPSKFQSEYVVRDTSGHTITPHYPAGDAKTWKKSKG